MATYCTRLITEASKGLMNESEVKSLLDQLKELANKEARQKLSGLDDALDSVSQQLIDSRTMMKINKEREILNNLIVKNKIDNHLSGFKNKVDGLVAYEAGIQSNIKNSRYSTSGLSKYTIDNLLGKVITKFKENGNLMDTFKDPNNEISLGKAAYGEKVESNRVKMAMDILQETMNDARKMCNSVGGSIGSLKEYLGRQIHNPEKMLRTNDSFLERTKLRVNTWMKYKNDPNRAIKVNEELQEIAYKKWSNEMLRGLDLERSFNTTDPVEIDKIFRSFFNWGVKGFKDADIVKEGLDTIYNFKPFGSTAKRLSHERVFHFKDGESWIRYNKTYGHGSVQKAILHTIERLGKDYAVMKTWGTNPNAMFDKVTRELIKTSPDIKINKKLNHARNVFKELTGEAGLSVNTTISKFMSSMRALKNMDVLGMVLVSSFGDVANVIGMLRSNGRGFLEARADIFRRFLSDKTEADSRIILDSIGINSRSTFGHMLAQYHAGDTPFGLVSKAHEKFFSLTGINNWDPWLRNGSVDGLSRMLALMKDKPFEALEEGTRRGLEIYGIEEKEWELIRNNPVNPYGNTQFITPDTAQYFSNESIAKYLGKGIRELKSYEITDVKNDIQHRLGVYFTDQVDHAVLSTSERTRAYLLQGLPSGSLWGEIARCSAQLKWYNTEHVQKVIGRFLFGRGGIGRADVRGMAEYMVNGLLLGYTSILTTDLLTGKGIPDPTNTHVILRAMSRGVLGFFGDLMIGEFYKHGAGSIGYVAGPTIGTLGDAANILLKLGHGESASRQTINLIQNNIPFSNLWFSNWAVKHFIVDEIKERMDPGYKNVVERNLLQTNTPISLPFGS